MSGTKPNGLSIEPTCEVRGFPLAPAAPAVDLVLEADYAGESVQVPLSIQINGVLSVTPPSATLPGVSGLPVTFTAAGGQPPYAFSTVGAGSVQALSDVTAMFTSGASGATQVQVTDSTGHVATALVSNRHTWVNGAVDAFASDPATQSVYVGGSFTRAGYVTAPNLLAIDSDNAQPRFELDVQSGFDGGVTALCNDGVSLYAAGAFRTYRGLPAHGVAKIDIATAALDTRFTQALGVEGANPTALLCQGDILYVGLSLTGASTFSYRNSSTTSVVLALDSRDGSLRPAIDILVNPSAGVVLPTSVHTLALLGGDLLVAGFFATSQGAQFSAARVSSVTPWTWKAPFPAAVNAAVTNGSDVFVATTSAVTKLDATTGVADCGPRSRAWDRPRCCSLPTRCI